MEDHTRAVAEKARDFATAFEAGELAYYLGILHDLGKFTDKFQQYLHDCHNRPNNPPPKGSAPHKQMGALATMMQLEGYGDFLALPLLGHHGGMSGHGLEAKNAVLCKTSQDEVRELLKRAADVAVDFSPSAPDCSRMAGLTSPESLEMFLRMLYACLVDADALDTEAHSHPDDAKQRENPMHTMQVLAEKLREVMRNKQEEATPPKTKPSTVNTVRAEVYQACQQAAALPPGVFSLTVPTGGGKTLASLTFALEHACTNNLRHIIYAIPYTSITTQTAATFQDIFGENSGVVLEHHSALEQAPQSRSERESEEEILGDAHWLRLVTQNWDAPIVVTTTVQLFESLYGRKPSKCRKLHRLAGSVIILDEVQTLPPYLLEPILSGLKILTEEYGATVLLCTATQPALQESQWVKGFANVTPIISPKMQSAHFEALRRVTYTWETNPLAWSEVAIKMQKETQSLCVVNTRRHALELLAEFKGNTSVLHLSTLLCGRHRKDVLSEVKNRLKLGEEIYLVSTQIIEAGVDVDFPIAFRSLGPLDRIIQTAGRCNREGLRSATESLVTIFQPIEDKTPPGIYRIAHEQTQAWYKAGKLGDLHAPELITRWFAELYGNLGAWTDKAEVMKKIQALDYPEVAKRMQMIDQDTVPIFVTDYLPVQEEAKALQRTIERNGKMNRSDWRKIQPFTVNVMRTLIRNLPVVPLIPDVDIYLWQGNYHPVLGLEGVLNGSADAVIYEPSKLMA